MCICMGLLYIYGMVRVVVYVDVRGFTACVSVSMYVYVCGLT